MTLAAPLAANLVGVGFSWRKQRLLRRFAGRRDIRFLPGGGTVLAGSSVLLWGSAEAPAAAARVVRVEDGFLRSVGLGADLTLPLSWVFDDVGIYYDASRPSALELRLQSGGATAAQLERAAAFRERVVAAGLTKYNLAAPRWQRPSHAAQVVLVPGQVETDASIRFGAAEVRTNLALLRAVREARPDAWIVYKPHPDVVAGLRSQGAHEAQAARHCDEVLAHADMAALLAQVDEVHVMTSLAGFEALLRGKPVTCWGQPFYAGWGLTQDRAPIARRTRAVVLDDLVSAALLEYPVYLDRATRSACSPERALASLLEWRERGGATQAWWRRWIRPLLARP
jgi:capsular polysaccharide export protein